MKEHTVLYVELGLLRGELTNQITAISEVEESMSTKISVIEESILNKIYKLEETVATIKGQMK